MLKYIRKILEDPQIISDPEGSYTGKPIEEELPVQDVDDL